MICTDRILKSGTATAWSAVSSPAEQDEECVRGPEKVGDFIDDRTGGKHSRTIDTAVGKAQNLIEKPGDKRA
ncbi:hypothetical protein GCM10009549_51500 [Streptomyces thermoalcalitolerans]|uniref:Antitoxin n=2 Tax=Streptomyces thermoalcalitolerans TaxID=65605 RepID=A0ABN1PJ11_9ACTN